MAASKNAAVTRFARPRPRALGHSGGGFSVTNDGRGSDAGAQRSSRGFGKKCSPGARQTAILKQTGLLADPDQSPDGVKQNQIEYDQDGGGGCREAHFPESTEIKLQKGRRQVDVGGKNSLVAHHSQPERKER